MALITNSMAFYSGKALQAWLGLTNMELLYVWIDAFLTGEHPGNLTIEVRDVATPLILFEVVPVGREWVIRSLPYQEESASSAHSEEIIRFFKELRSSISHDLRAPVRQLRLYTQKIISYSKAEIPEAIQEEMGFLNESSGDLLRRFESLALLVENESRPLELNQVDFSHLIRIASGAFSLHLKDTGGVIEVGPLPNVIGDQELLLGITAEILNNGIDHIPADRSPRISISAREYESGVVILFGDNGIGFDNHLASKIFSPYSAIHESPESGQLGPGMGLTIARRAAERMGMSLTASGEKGQGAIFSLEVPGHLILE